MPSRDKPDAIALLKEDHRKVEDLFEKAEKARDEDRKKMLVQQICTELMIHSMVEEEIFYPACKDKIEEEDVLDEAYVEHDGAKVLIAELLDSEPDAEFYDAKVKVLSELIKHHVKEEEKRSEGLFAQAREAGLDIEALGRAHHGAQRAAEAAVRRRQPAAAAYPQLLPATSWCRTIPSPRPATTDRDACRPAGATRRARRHSFDAMPRRLKKPTGRPAPCARTSSALPRAGLAIGSPFTILPNALDWTTTSLTPPSGTRSSKDGSWPTASRRTACG